MKPDEHQIIERAYENYVEGVCTMFFHSMTSVITPEDRFTAPRRFQDGIKAAREARAEAMRLLKEL